MEFFSLAGNIAAHIEDSGSGSGTILLLHGYMETMYIWEDVFEELCSAGYRVIRMDLPGHGLTCTAPVDTMELMATVAKGVLDVCKVEKATVVGHSMGGFAAINCCRMFPERFSGLVLLNSHPYADTPEQKTQRQREIDVIESGHLLSLAELSIPRTFHESNLRPLDEKIREIVELCETHDPAGIVAGIKGMEERGDTSDFLEKCRLPKMAICGDSDFLVTAQVRDRLAADCPSLPLEVLPECGHNAFLEAPERTMELLKGFLTRENC